MTLAVDFYGPAPIKMYAVYHDDLAALETLSEKEQYAFGGAMASAGISLSTLVALLTSPPKDPFIFAGLVAGALVFFVATVTASVATYFCRKDRKAKSASIRERGHMRINYSVSGAQVSP